MIVGISGVIGSGKSTAAKFMEKHGYVVVGLADPLKRISQEIHQFSHSQLFGTSSKRSIPHPTRFTVHGNPLTPRYSLQRLGDWGRECYRDTWIEYGIYVASQLMLDFQQSYKPGMGVYQGNRYDIHRKGVVFHDIRFWNELKAIRRAGGKLVRLKRGMEKPSLIERIKRFFRISKVHHSESEQLSIPDYEFDYVFENGTMSLEELESTMGRLCKELEKS